MNYCRIMSIKSYEKYRKRIDKNEKRNYTFIKLYNFRTNFFQELRSSYIFYQKVITYKINSKIKIKKVIIKRRNFYRRRK